MDMIDFSTVTILNSPNVRAWPVTATLTRISCTLEDTRIEFTKQSGPDAWPVMALIEGNLSRDVQYSLWVFRRISGAWFGSTFLEPWPNDDHLGENLFDILRDKLSLGRGPDPVLMRALEPGQQIGFMVSAGAATVDGRCDVFERSNIVVIDVPDGDVGDFTWIDAEPPASGHRELLAPPAPSVELEAAPEAAALTDDEKLQRAMDDLLNVGDAIVDALGAMVEAVDRVSRQLQAITDKGLQVHT